MPSRPLIVLADDLTGAAEVAAIAHEAGLRAVVLTTVPPAPVDADVVVVDTDTRLARPAGAARRVQAWTRRLRAWPHAGVFKKTDSVLRGCVRAELKATAEALGCRRTLLVAGNPSLGRVIRGGLCYVDGRPIDRTTFARDPHHPRRSPAVANLLGTRAEAITAGCTPDASLPRTGLIVGDHRTVRDSTDWVRVLDAHTLPAGGADFFRAWLRAQRPPARRRITSAPLPGPTLLLHGTTATPAPSGALRFSGLRPPPPARVRLAIRLRDGAAVAASDLTRNDPRAPARIVAGFGKLAHTLLAAQGYRHLLIAGGATAAAVLHELGWTQLHVVRVWAPGVVSLQSLDAGCLVTVKPGSYPWPAALRRAAAGAFS
jgi:uncharacterized protein YgbK (DUF1537 family)